MSSKELKFKPLKDSWLFSLDDFNQTLAEAQHDQIERKALSTKKPKFKKPFRRGSPAEQIETTQIIPTAHLCVNPKKVNELQAWSHFEVFILIFTTNTKWYPMIV